jgi:hypothetical protein
MLREVLRSSSLLVFFALAACSSDPDDDPTTDAGSADASVNRDATSLPDANPADATSFEDAESGDAIVSLDANDVDDAGTTPSDGATVPLSFTEYAIDESRRHGQGQRVLDVDGDLDNDVVVAWSLADEVVLYLNENNGQSFTEKSISGPGAIVAMHTCVADLDGDVDLDIAAIGLFDRDDVFNSPGVLTWYENPGNPLGNWTEHPINPDIWGARYLECGELTGDGQVDLIVGSVPVQGMSAGLIWFRGNKGAFVGPNVIDQTIAQAETIAVGDLDQNGVLDVIAVSASANEVYWFENQRAPGEPESSPSFVRHVLAAPSAPYGLAVGNFDGDAALEVAISSDDRLELYDPPADPRQSWVMRTIDPQFGSNGDTRLALADFNLDGAADLAVSAQSPAEIRVYINDRGAWLPKTVTTGWTGASFVAAGDLDGDRRDDVLTSTYENSGSADKITWWRTNP